MYCEWGVDFIKVDDISFPYAAGEIELIQNAISKSKRDIVLSLSPGQAPLECAEHLKNHANMWRVSGDFWDMWDHLYTQFDLLNKWNEHMGPGHWPDGDMLPFGHVGIRSCEHGRGDRWTYFTKDEQVTLMSLWCIARSPLMFGGEMRDNDEWTLNLITNEEVLSILNNSNSNKQVYRKDDKVVWTAKNDDGDAYVALFNLTDKNSIVEFSLAELGLKTPCNARDLWLHNDLGTINLKVFADVAPHSCKLYKLKEVK
jgi:hypothetical protein